MTYDPLAAAQAHADRELDGLPLAAPPRPDPVLHVLPARSPRTSREAAGSMRGAAKAQRIRVLQWLEARGDLGGTQEEASDALEISRQSMCARMWELEQAGLIEKTDRERPTSSRRPAAVYVRRRRS